MPRMARRPLDPGFYHLTARGNRGERIFLTERDRTTFFGLVERAAAPESFVVRAYCLMSTHYHLLVETQTAELSVAMRDVNGIYARWFNKEHGLRGRLFEERFHSERVEDDPHLLEILRYLALNPVRAGLALTPARWRWGSFAAVMGWTRAPSFLDVRWTLRLFSNDPSDAKRRFSKFVEDAPDRPMS